MATGTAGESHRTDASLLGKELNGIRWFHRIDLGNGVVTPGTDRSQWKLERIKLPQDLSGKSVLDVGAWDGFFSFEAERRGATRVLATDSFAWAGGFGGSKAGFEFARRTLGSHVEDMEIDVMELSPDRVGTFDVVLFLGVLYHMRHPLLALERIASVTGDLLILETATDMLWTRRPAVAFYPEDELAADATNWWGPNLDALFGMLRSVGFRSAEVVTNYGLAARAFRAGREAFSRRAGFLEALAQGRTVVHGHR